MVTATQRLMWVGQRVDPAAPLYNMAFLFAIDGPVDPNRFAAAVEVVFASCDALSLTFENVTDAMTGSALADAPTQAATDSTPSLDGVGGTEGNIPHRLLDFSTTKDPQEAATFWAQRQTEIPYATGQPLWRSALLKVHDGRYLWWLDQHHLVTDAASCAILFEQVGLAYESAAAGTAWRAKASERSFLRYQQFEADQQQNPRYGRRVRYWQVFKETPPPPWEAYAHTPARRTLRSSRHLLRLDASVTGRIRAAGDPGTSNALSADAGTAAVFAALLSGLLHRIGSTSGQRFGLLVGNRSEPWQQQAIGCLIETCPFDLQFCAGDNFFAAHRLAITQLQQAARHSAPGISAATAGAPPSVVLNYLPYQFGTFAGHPITAEWLHSGYADANHHVRLQICQFAGDASFELLFDLNNEAFDAAAQRSFLEQFERLATQWLAEPAQALADVQLTEVFTMRRREVDFNATRQPVAPLDLVTALRDPGLDANVMAVIDGTLRFTRSELFLAADLLAHKLRAQGVGKGALVPLILAPSAEAVLAVHAILRTGAAFVPLDPTHPSERHAMVLEELVATAGSAPLLCHADHPTTPAQDHLVVDAAGLRQELRERQDRPEQIVQDIASSVGPPEGTALPSRSPDSLCYVLYTSGSTGRPKGVRVADRSLVNYLSWAAGYYGANEPVSMPLFTSLAFDATLTSLFLPTLSGGCIEAFSEHGTDLTGLLHSAAKSTTLTHMKLTPAHLNLLKPDRLEHTGLQALILGGEILERSQALRIQREWPGPLEVYNEYGPTETVIGCSVHRFDADRDLDSAVPVGKPIANTTLYILDEQLRTTPTGVAGELYIGGNGVSLGYLNRPEETAQRFVPNPFQPGERFYRSGDRARWLDEARFEFLGRGDRQIKLHGHRIELDEISAVLSGHPGVDACAVQLNQLQTDSEEVFCKRCGISSTYPSLSFSKDGVCSTCEAYDGYRSALSNYFKTPDALKLKFAEVRKRRRGDYDCIMLLSGGKDSSYVLYQLAALDLDILTFTLDNGFISEGAKQNIRRVTEDLGVDHVFGTTEHMNEILLTALRGTATSATGASKRSIR